MSYCLVNRGSITPSTAWKKKEEKKCWCSSDFAVKGLRFLLEDAAELITKPHGRWLCVSLKHWGLSMMADLWQTTFERYCFNEDVCILIWISLKFGPWGPINWLRPSDAIWWHRSGSTLAQVMACCLTAPSHYLNECWQFISKVQLRSSDGNFTRDTSAISE